MATSLATGRSNLVRAICRASKFSSSGTRIFSVPLRPSNSIPYRTPIPPHPLSPRLLQRQLSSLQSVHFVVASACLVPKLPREATTSTEDSIAKRFVELTMAHRGEVKAIMMTVIPLPSEEEKEVKETLKDIIGCGKKVNRSRAED